MVYLYAWLEILLVIGLFVYTARGVIVTQRSTNTTTIIIEAFSVIVTLSTGSTSDLTPKTWRPVSVTTRPPTPPPPITTPSTASPTTTGPAKSGIVCNYEGQFYAICRFANAWSYENGSVCVGITRCAQQSPPYGVQARTAV